MLRGFAHPKQTVPATLRAMRPADAVTTAPAADLLRVRLAITVMIVIWGTTWGAIRIGLGGIPPLTAVSLRFWIAGALMLLVMALMKVRFPRAPVFWWMILANGLLLFTGSYCVVYWCEQWVPSGLGAVIFATYPLLVLILAHFVLPGERMTRRAILGTILGFCGVLVVFSEDLAALLGREAAFGAVLLLLSPLVSAIASVIVKRWGDPFSPFAVNAASMWVGALSTGLLALAFERGRVIVWSAASLGSLLYLAVFGSAVTFGLYFWLLRRFAASRMSLIAYATPIVAVTLGSFVLDEPFTWRMAAGALLVVLGVAWAMRGH